jgi:hypothetical protein
MDSWFSKFFISGGLVFENCSPAAGWFWKLFCGGLVLKIVHLRQVGFHKFSSMAVWFWNDFFLQWAGCLSFWPVANWLLKMFTCGEVFLEIFAPATGWLWKSPPPYSGLVIKNFRLRRAASYSFSLVWWGGEGELD